jgi:K+-transporting ATPase ATPase C chain
MPSQLRPALVCFFLLSFATGVVYPLVVTGAATLLFPRQASGSVFSRDGRVVGSLLVGQRFAGERYFWGRPSATSPGPYNGAASGGSNLGPANRALHEAVRDRVAALRAAHPGQEGPVPADLVTASASGLDPHISPAAAEYQVGRVAGARGMAPERVREMLRRHTEGRDLGLLGEPRVNVLSLNLALDGELP